MDYSVSLTVAVFITILIAVVLLFTAGIIPALMVFGIAAFILFLLQQFGKFEFQITPTALEFDFHENAPSGKNSSYTTTPLVQSQLKLQD
jgi:fatty acid desaturase